MNYIIRLFFKWCVVGSILSAPVINAAPASTTNLPDTVLSALNKAGVSSNNVSVFVQALPAKPALIKAPLVHYQATQSLNPASTSDRPTKVLLLP